MEVTTYIRLRCWSDELLQHWGYAPWKYPVTGEFHGFSLVPYVSDSCTL